MGPPVGPHSTPAPAGTTAIPGLIPDLIARLPWPRWAIIVIAVAAGVLMVSCLLCAVCCCRRRGHRKKPRDREAVGLGSPQGTTSSHLEQRQGGPPTPAPAVEAASHGIREARGTKAWRPRTPAPEVQPDVDTSETAPEDAQHWGRLQLSLEYDFSRQEIKVGLKQAADLRACGPGGTADPYARVSLSTQAGHSHETRVHRGTLCPAFQETCCFHIPQEELAGATLRVQVLGSKRFSAPEALGELSLPLGAVDLQHVLEQWYQLGPPGAAEPEPSGELCLSLRYVPSSGRMTVVVLEARGLSPGLADPYVKVQLMLNQRKWRKRKTSARKGTASPYFNEAFTFLVPFSQIQALSTGHQDGGKRNRAITARRQHLKSVMLQIAATELEKEEGRRESEKQNYLSEHCPPLHLPSSMSEVQELCKQLHAKIDAAEEEKYDMEVRVQKSTKELEDMNQKLFDLRGKFKRPPLRRVRMSADAMLKALLGSKHKVCMDLRANLKQVKKEDTEKERDLRDVGDWRKNIEEKSGMEGRKKMFETES
ncbi:troponin I, fast skeletal muscle isoform X1 [Mustela nigripes]|uniref:troponin I, fast skeletal muscle isoform X1 n=2 Tax=Mustela nigripes TaxID=77151 RepID=UPI002815A748|nr:troponin I, fast skeletal muscle isoform X1 [Mustela nigripes]XP_059254474.1 troponin I, fast skeletal muscle isoform X1 [Mustela nigripes]